MKEDKSLAGVKPDTKEYKLGCAVANILRNRTNGALGDVLTMIEASLGETDQSKALKQLVKQRFWELADDNQHTVYYAFGQEPRQLGDDTYIMEVLNGTDNTATSPPSEPNH